MNSAEFSNNSNLSSTQTNLIGKILSKPKFVLKPAILHYGRPSLQNVQKSQQPIRVNLDKSNHHQQRGYGIVSIGNDGKPSNSAQINELPVKTVLKTCLKNELSDATNDGQQKPRERLIVHQYNPNSLFLMPSKLREPDSLIYCKVCGRVYQIFEALRHHLLFYHQVKISELEKWYERYPLSNPNKAAPDPSLQPRRGRPPKYTIYQQNDGKFTQPPPPSTYMSREEKMQRNQMLYERVICSLCQKDLFEDCMREHLKRVHGILSANSEIGNYIGMRIRPMMKEEKMNEGYEEVEGEGNEGNEESTSSKSKISMVAEKKDDLSHIRLVVCAVCKKALRRDSLREHLRTRHNIETAGLKEAKEHIFDELDWIKSSEDKHRRYESLQTHKEMYEDSLKDESGRIYCMLCDEAVFPGNLRSHLNIQHGISMAFLMTKDAVAKYSIKVNNVGGEMGEEMEKLMEAEEPMTIIKNEIQEEEQATNDSSIPTTSTALLLNISPIDLSSIEVKAEMPPDNEE